MQSRLRSFSFGVFVIGPTVTILAVTVYFMIESLVGGVLVPLSLPVLLWVLAHPYPALAGLFTSVGLGLLAVTFGLSLAKRAARPMPAPRDDLDRELAELLDAGASYPGGVRVRGGRS